MQASFRVERRSRQVPERGVALRPDRRFCGDDWGLVVGRHMRTLGLAALLVLLALLLPSASGAGNHAVFTDPVGDNGGGLASDITSVDVTSVDDGEFTFKIALNDPQGRLFTGDSLVVAIDWDGNTTNGLGGTGFDTLLRERGSSSGSPRFEFCNYTDREECATYTSEEATDVPTGANSHLVTFENSQGGWTLIRFFVFETYTAADGKSYSDATSLITFDMNADPDGDGYTGSDDTCPTIKAGKQDKDRDGCPDPLAKPRYAYTWEDSIAPVVSFRDFRVTGAPPGTAVTVRYAGGVAHRQGSGSVKGILGRSLHVGSAVTIIYSAPARIGSFLMLRIGAKSVSTVRAGCTARGSTKLLSRCP